MLTGRPISSRQRPEAGETERIESIKFGLDLPRPDLVQTLDLRVGLMYENGLIEETRELLDCYPQDCRAFDAIGYREAVRLINGEMDRDQAIAETRKRTRAYAKRQITWLRAEKGIHWIDMRKSQESGLDEMTAVINARFGESSR